jgi:hypothetical protein
MTNKKMWWGMLVGLLALGLIVAGCPTDNGEPDPWPLEEHLRKYMGPSLQTWDDDEDVPVYFLDSDRFDAFKAELDKVGEYSQADEWTEDDRDWDRDRALARWAVKPDGAELTLCRTDNSLEGYWYEPVSTGAKPKTEELLRKYMGPNPETWSEDGGKITYVYYLDPDRFDEFKAELDAGGAYAEGEGYTRMDQDRSENTRARWCVRPSGRLFRLDLWDNDTKQETEYRYVKNG